jgi:hypothetical protein
MLFKNISSVNDDAILLIKNYSKLSTLLHHPNIPLPYEGIIVTHLFSLNIPLPYEDIITHFSIAEIPVITISGEDHKIADTPIEAWLQGQKVMIIPIFGNGNLRHYDFCHICGASPYGIEMCNPQLHSIKIVHDQIYQLRGQYSELEKRAHTLGGRTETDEEGKIIILKQIEQLQLNIKSL